MKLIRIAFGSNRAKWMEFVFELTFNWNKSYSTLWQYNSMEIFCNNMFFHYSRSAVITEKTNKLFTFYCCNHCQNWNSSHWCIRHFHMFLNEFCHLFFVRNCLLTIAFSTKVVFVAANQFRIINQSVIANAHIPLHLLNVFYS